MEKPSSRPINNSPAQQTAMTTETETGVKEVGEMALNFTQRNIASSFEFAEKAVRAAVMNQRPRPCSSETSRTEQGGYLRAHLTPDVAAVA